MLEAPDFLFRARNLSKKSRIRSILSVYYPARSLAFLRSDMFAECSLRMIEIYNCQMAIFSESGQCGHGLFLKYLGFVRLHSRLDRI